VIRYVLPILWMTSYLLVSQGCLTSRAAEAQRTQSVGLGYKLCAVIPVAGQRTHGTTFRTALTVTSQHRSSGGGVCGLCSVRGSSDSAFRCQNCSEFSSRGGVYCARERGYARVGVVTRSVRPRSSTDGRSLVDGCRSVTASLIMRT